MPNIQRFPNSPAIVVFGAGGRAGRAVSANAARRGHRVTAVVRDPERYSDLASDRIRVVAGNALDPRSVSAHVSAGDAIVSAITPFATPPSSFTGFDTSFYERAASALDTPATHFADTRLVIIGLFATLQLEDGSTVLDHSELFPADLRPFAAAHEAGIDRLRSGASSDWVVLAPPPRLLADGRATGKYRLGDRRADLAGWDIPLSYFDLATAVVDEVKRPTLHREVFAVYGV